MSASVSGEIKAEPNLTPLLDVVFQLITFFMLVINFSNDTYDQRIRLPVAASAAAPEGAQAGEDRLVFNINERGDLLWAGEELDPESALKVIKAESQVRARSFERDAKKKGDAFDPTNLPTTIVIRCDRGTQYTQVYRYITACQNFGFRKFALKAMNGDS